MAKPCGCSDLAIAQGCTATPGALVTMSGDGKSVCTLSAVQAGCVAPTSVVGLNAAGAPTIFPAAGFKAMFQGALFQEVFRGAITAPTTYSAAATPITNLSVTLNNDNTCRTMKYLVIAKFARVPGARTLTGGTWQHWGSLITPVVPLGYAGNIHGHSKLTAGIDQNIYDLSADHWHESGTIAPLGTASFQLLEEMRASGGGSVQCQIGRTILTAWGWYD